MLKIAWSFALTLVRKRLLLQPLLDAGLAQLVEQLTLNQLVRGSSPRPGTKNVCLATTAFRRTSRTALD